MFPPGFIRGPIQGQFIIGEITEALHRWLLDGWSFDGPPPRIEEDLSFVPKDREEVLYVYMYRVEQNESLKTAKQWRPAKISVFGDPDAKSLERIYFERPPLYLNVFYMVAVHSRFRSDAERLLGWTLMRLMDATHLVYRPRKYLLPDTTPVDSTGQPWGVDNEGDDVIMEKVAVALVDDLTIGDTINFFTINEAPYRPFLTYRAQCAMEGPLVEGPPTTVRAHRMGHWDSSGDRPERSNGRIAGRTPSTPRAAPTPIGPSGFAHRPLEDNDSED